MKVKPKKMRGRKPAIVIVAVTLVIMAIPVLMFRLFTDRMVDNITGNLSLKYSEELNSQMSALISNTIDFYYHQMTTEYNSLKLLDNFDEEKIKKFISESEKDNDISYLAFADAEGYVYESDGSYLGTMRVPMLGRLLNGEEYVLSDSITIGSESFIMIGASFDEPIKMGDKTICIALLGMRSSDISKRVALQSEYSGGFSSIMNTDGSYVIKNRAQNSAGLNVYSILKKSYDMPDEELDALKKAIDSGETYIYSATQDGNVNSVYLYFAPIEGTEWYIVNNLPSAFIKNSVVELRDSLEKVYIIFVVFFAVIALLIILQQMSSGHKLKQSQTELEETLKYAEQASNAKTAFLFNMSHDIRTPMNAILGYTDIGLRHMDSPEITKDSYKKIKTAGGHLLSLINDILEMSRIESGKMAINEKPIDIRKAIADVTTMSKSLAIAKSMDYETVIGDIRNPYIYADELHINEVIINIVSNAVKYTPEEGRVRYTINQIDDVKDGKTTFRFEITDNGIGMSEEFQKHLFETFSREQNTTMSKIEGTGLGLSIVKKIVDIFGGDIKVYSVQGEGSTFIVEIPFRVMDEEAIREFTAENEETAGVPADIDFTGKRVLLTEDNEMNREIATEILEDAGLEVDVAEDGEIAVKTVIEKGIEYYDFILMDIQMPVMNGYEATKEIRKLQGGGKIPIIALSANAFEEDKKKSIENGMNAHVAKPIDIKNLFETIQWLIK